MECRLQQQSSSRWKCQVLLRFETGPDGRRLSKIEETSFGPDVFDTGELEARLRRAQLAILNPSVLPESFLEESFDPLKLAKGAAPLGSSEQLEFSSNVVCVNVVGPNVPDLSFVDLPGVSWSTCKQPRYSDILGNDFERDNTESRRPSHDRQCQEHGVKAYCRELLDPAHSREHRWLEAMSPSNTNDPISPQTSNKDD